MVHALNILNKLQIGIMIVMKILHDVKVEPDFTPKNFHIFDPCCCQSRGLEATSLFLRVVSADHDGVGGCSEDGSDVRQKKRDPEPVVKCLLS